MVNSIVNDERGGTKKGMIKLKNEISLATNILRYLKLRTTIKPEQGEHIFLCPAGIGDTYILCSLSEAFINKHGGTFSIIVPEKQSFIAKLFPSVSKTLVTNKIPSASISRFFMNIYKEEFTKRIQWGHPYWLMAGIAGYKDLRFVDAYKMFLGIALESRLSAPGKVNHESVFRAAKIFDDLRLPIGRTVVMIPHSNSLKRIEKAIWIKIVDELKCVGLLPVTNVGQNEEPIPGTASVSIPLEEIIPFVKLAGHVVSTRCGLADLVSNFVNRLTVLYPDQVWFDRIHAYDFFSLRENGIVPDGKEIQELTIGGEVPLEVVLENIKDFHTS